MITKLKTRKATGQNAPIVNIDASEKQTRKPLTSEQIKLGDFASELEEIHSLSTAVELAIRGEPAVEVEFDAIYVLMMHVNNRLNGLLGKMNGEAAEVEDAA
jgi:hypothetical protein